MNLTLQCRRFKENVYNTLQWAERQRGLKAKSALGCGIHVGLKDSLNSASKGATNVMVLRQIKLEPFLGLSLSHLFLCGVTARATLGCWDGGRRQHVKVHLVCQ